jgi:K+-transporting ATPase ATPase B chain
MSAPPTSAPATSSWSARARSFPPTATSIEGAATVDESAITGESAPVIRESGGDRSAVTGGTRVLSDEIKIRISANPGEGFLGPHDLARRRGLAPKNAERNRPHHSAGRPDLIFLLVCITLKPFGIYAASVFSIPVLIALLVCLIPTTIGGLLSAIGIAGMDRLLQHNVLAMSGRAVEASGDVDVLLARQNRHHHARQPPGHRIPARASGHR